MSVVAIPPRTLVKAWGGLVALGAATSLLAAVVGPPPIPLVAAAVVLALAWLKARVILRRYLGLAAAPSWRGAFDVAIAAYALLLFGLFSIPVLRGA